MSSINSRVPPLRLAAVDTPSDGQVASYQSSSGQFEWVDASSVSPGGTSGSIQYNDGAGGFTGSTKMIYDDTDAKITLTTGGNTLFIDAGGSPQLSFDGTGTGNIPTIAGDGGEAGGTGLLLLGNNSVSNNYMWFNKGSDQIQIIAPSASESIKINSNLGGNIEITATGGSQDVILSATTGNVKIEGLTYPTSDGTANQVLKTDGLGVLSFTDAATGTVSSVGLSETGSALTITGSPITTSGTINIAGAGTSSQVILGDLSLGTLTNGTVTGTGTANQVSYWTSTTAQAGSTGLTYNPSTGDLTVGGYVESGTGKFTTDSGTTDLTLDTNDGAGSSGSIVIQAGGNGQISINPHGTGTIKLDGVELDNTAIATGYVLKATSATEAGWAAESSGGSPGGSDTQIQYNNGGSFGGISSFTYDDTASSEKFVIEASSDQELVRITQTGSGDAFVVEDASNPDSTRFAINNAGRVGIGITPNNLYALYVNGNIQTQGGQVTATRFLSNIGGTETGPRFLTSGDLNTGMFFPAADNVAFTTGGTEKLRISSAGEIGLSGANYGSSGQVLTSNGSGSAASWTTVSGGGSTDELYIPYCFTDADSGFNQHRRGLTYWSSLSNSNSFNEQINFLPFRAPRTETVSSLGIYLSTVYGTDPDDAVIGVYTSKSSTTDNNIIPKLLQFSATFDMGAGTGHRASTITVASGGSATLTKGELYFIAYAPTNNGSDTNSQVQVSFPPISGVSPGNSTRNYIRYTGWSYGDTLALDAETAYESGLEGAGSSFWAINYSV